MCSVFIGEFTVSVDSAVSVGNFLHLVLEEFTFFAFSKFHCELELCRRNYLLTEFNVFWSEFSFFCNRFVIRCNTLFKLFTFFFRHFSFLERLEVSFVLEDSPFVHILFQDCSADNGFHACV